MLFHRSDLRVQRLEFPPEQNYAAPPFSLGLQTSDLKPSKASSDMTFILGKALKSPKQIKIELNRAACPGSCAVWRLCCWWFRGGCCRVSVRSWLARSARTVVGASDSVLTAVVQGTQLASLHLRHWFLFFSAAVVSVLASLQLRFLVSFNESIVCRLGPSSDCPWSFAAAKTSSLQGPPPV